jgi:hypothetical protein
LGRCLRHCSIRHQSNHRLPIRLANAIRTLLRQQTQCFPHASMVLPHVRPQTKGAGSAEAWGTRKFLGYPENTTGYRAYDPLTHKVARADLQGESKSKPSVLNSNSDSDGEPEVDDLAETTSSPDRSDPITSDRPTSPSVLQPIHLWSPWLLEGNDCECV